MMMETIEGTLYMNTAQEEYIMRAHSLLNEPYVAGNSNWYLDKKVKHKELKEKEIFITHSLYCFFLHIQC